MRGPNLNFSRPSRGSAPWWQGEKRATAAAPRGGSGGARVTAQGTAGGRDLPAPGPRRARAPLWPHFGIYLGLVVRGMGGVPMKDAVFFVFPLGCALALGAMLALLV